MSKPQVVIIGAAGVLIIIIWGIFASLMSRQIESVAISTPALPSPLPLPKHIVASVMNDPFDDVPDDRNYERPWLQIVVPEWRSFSESDAWTLSNYYLEQYPRAEFLTIDFMCDYSYTSSTREFSHTPDWLYNPHVLFRFVQKWYEWVEEKKQLNSGRKLCLHRKLIQILERSASDEVSIVGRRVFTSRDRWGMCRCIEMGFARCEVLLRLLG